LASGLRRCADGYVAGDGHLGRVGLQFLQAQLQLRDLRIELFGGTAELHPLQLCQLQLHLLD
jgi:hypothetical protein